MNSIRLVPNRRFPSIPSIAQDVGNHTQALMAIKEAVEVGKRDTSDLLNSYVRVKDLVDMGFATLESGLLVPAEFSSDSGVDTDDQTALEVSYDPTASGLYGDTVQEAIDELALVVDSIETLRDAVSVLAVSSNDVAVNVALGDYFTLALTANVTTWSFTNIPAAAHGRTLMIRIRQDSSPRTVAWPAAFKWSNGVAGVVSTGNGATDLLAITTVDGGTTWLATLGKTYS